MRAAAPILLTWFAASAFNCDGTAAGPLRYFVQTERVVKVGEIVDPDGSTWTIELRSHALSEVQPVGSLTLAEPEVGGMVYWRLFDRDAADNEGEECAP